eukprot:TRINITY_DN654_c5_g1_i1.p1 TRINITY_DN654_c5_g1~~TRINITY_DN654_c5_g1_i1.p1  ORF type:complete len:176 (-),score=21.64 TRINITY_DN654_c5_g1_i1:82-609(-)
MAIWERACSVYFVAVALLFLEVRSLATVAVPSFAPAASSIVVSLASTGPVGITLDVLALKQLHSWYHGVTGLERRNFKPLVTIVGAVPIVVGADVDALTWDCWKPILHDTSVAPSRGRLLTDVLNDPAVSEFIVGNSSVFVRNRWNESWRIDPVILPWGQIAAHAFPSTSFFQPA